MALNATDSGHDRGIWRRARPPLLILFASAAVFILVVLDAPMRAVPVLTYIAVVPGLACVRLVRVPDTLTVAVLGIGLSFALGIVVAETLLTLRLWSPLLGLSTLAGIASLAALAEWSRAGALNGRTPGGGQR